MFILRFNKLFHLNVVLLWLTKVFLNFFSPFTIIVSIIIYYTAFVHTINNVYLKTLQMKKCFVLLYQKLNGYERLFRFYCSQFWFQWTVCSDISISCLILRDLHYLHLFLYFSCNKTYILYHIYRLMMLSNGA